MLNKLRTAAFAGLAIVALCFGGQASARIRARVAHCGDSGT